MPGKSNKNLHHRIGPGHFKLHIHRTEVCRDPVGATEPIFPLQGRYYQCNYTVEGLEKKRDTEIVTESVDYTAMEPPVDQGIIDGKAVEHCDTMDYKFTIDGKKLKVDEGGGVDELAVRGVGGPIVVRQVGNIFTDRHRQATTSPPHHHQRCKCAPWPNQSAAETPTRPSPAPSQSADPPDGWFDDDDPKDDPAVPSPDPGTAAPEADQLK